MRHFDVYGWKVIVSSDKDDASAEYICCACEGFGYENYVVISPEGAKWRSSRIPDAYTGHLDDDPREENAKNAAEYFKASFYSEEEKEAFAEWLSMQW